MPELPEVETVKLGLQKYLIGNIIEDVEIRYSKIFYGDKNDIIRAKIADIKRIGKGLIIELDNGFVIAIHLKMTGQLIFRDSQIQNIPISSKVLGGVPSKHTHVIFKIKSPHFAKASRGEQNSERKTNEVISYLYFNDIRKFGWIKVLKTEDIKRLPFFKEMGLDPLKELTIETFTNILSASNLPIKVLLMDQKKIGGIGNIYANEGLFEAGIDPRRKAKTLTEAEIKKLYDSIRLVLKKGIKYEGASDERFVNILGQDGHFQEHFKVYGRDGKDCARCAGQITKIQLGGRGTFFCPKCQR